MRLEIKDIKLKHLNSIASDPIDFPYLMEEILDYKNTFLDRTVLFKWKFKKVYSLIALLRDIDISKLSIDSQCDISMPEDIDSISYQARVELDGLTQGDNQADVIAITCFEKVHERKFNSDTDLFQQWKQSILNRPLVEMMGLYNEISKALEESNKVWQMLFEQVEIEDPDYEAANGPALLGRFNLLNIIKKVMRDFNVSYKEAFLMQYQLVQVNNLESSSKGYVEQQMRTIKEKRFKAQRGA